MPVFKKHFLILFVFLLYISPQLSCNNDNNPVVLPTNAIKTDLLKDTIIDAKKIIRLKYQAIESIDASKPNYFKHFERYLYPAFLKWIVKEFPKEITEQEAKQLFIKEYKNEISAKRHILNELIYSVRDSIKIFVMNSIIFSKLTVITTSKKSKKHISLSVLGISKDQGLDWQFLTNEDNAGELKDILELEFSPQVTSLILSK